MILVLVFGYLIKLENFLNALISYKQPKYTVVVIENQEEVSFKIDLAEISVLRKCLYL